MSTHSEHSTSSKGSHFSRTSVLSARAWCCRCLDARMSVAQFTPHSRDGHSQKWHRQQQQAAHPAFSTTRGETAFGLEVSIIEQQQRRHARFRGLGLGVG